MKKRILFRVDGNSEVGLGHFYRCLSLATMLTDNYDICFAMAEPARELIDILSSEGISLEPLTKDNDRHSKIERVEFELYKRIRQSDLIVVDGYDFSENYLLELIRSPLPLVIIEDTDKTNCPVDLIINHAPGLDLKAYVRDSNAKYLAIGTDYLLLRRAFLNKATIDSYETKTNSMITICLGGSDKANLSESITDWLLNNTTHNINLVLGSANEYGDSIRLKFENSTRVRIQQNISALQMANSFEEADLVIVPCSGLILEAVCCRTPIISGMTASNQKSIYNGLLKKEVFYDSVDFSISNFEKAFASVSELQSSRMIENQRQVIDGKSPLRLRKLFNRILSEVTLRMRLAVEDDCDQYYKWVNDAAVRKQSFNQNKVSFNEHTEWFNRKLCSERVKMFILEKRNHIGQIRFDNTESNIWYIDYSVDKKHRGFGYGQILVRMGLDLLSNETENCLVMAEVKSGNDSSLSIFRRLNFLEHVDDSVHTFSKRI